MPRGSKPGEHRGGRKPGTPNKMTADILGIMAALDCNPIEGMIRIALDKKNDVSIRLRAYAEVAQYGFPKRRSIEVTPGEMHPSGARLVKLEDLLADYREAKG